MFGSHSGRLFSTFTSRRSAAHPSADALSYESMLALDENNPKRGVKKQALDRLQSVRPLSCAWYLTACSQQWVQIASNKLEQLFEPGVSYASAQGHCYHALHDTLTDLSAPCRAWQAVQIPTRSATSAWTALSGQLVCCICLANIASAMPV